jgi:glutamine amidotransferase
MSAIAVIDYGMGNLRSVSKALEHVAPDTQIIITNQRSVIESADKVVLPGVGAISHCVEELAARGLAELVKKVATDKPFLGVCLGMQLLFDKSDENNGTEGLGVIPGTVPMFPPELVDNGFTIPHMGWNPVKHTIDHPLWHNIDDNAAFYFVHSYYAKPEDSNLISGLCSYGIDFCASIAHGNIFATQFHPEKSQHDGLQLLQNFANWNGK